MKFLLPPANLQKSVPTGIAIVASIGIAGMFHVLRLAVDPVLGARAPYTLAILAILLSAYYFRFIGGLAATIASIAMVELSFPGGQTAGSTNLFAPLLMLLAGSAISFVCDQMRLALTRSVAREEHVAEVAQETNRAYRLLDSILDNAPAIIVLLDTEGKVIRANRYMKSVVGLDPQSLIGTTPGEVAGEAGRTFESYVRRVLETGEDMVIDEFGVENPGTPFSGKWFSFVLFPTRDDTERIAGVAVIALDITERKNYLLEKEALFERERMARNDAERAARIKDEFVATLSHELRTPLTSIFGWLELIRRKPGDAAHVLEGVEAIERSTRLQLKMVEDLLDMSRISSGKLVVERELISGRDIVQTALVAIQPLAREHQVEILPSVRTEACVFADPHRMAQVLTNLLSNAIKFSKRGARVFVDVDRVDGAVRLQVRDEGEGIDPSNLDLVFERFRQAEGGITRRYGGLGLGLAIVRQLVDMHGGRVWAESDGLGKGATFTVELPEAKSLPTDGVLIPSKEAELEPDCLEGMEIALVDDDPETRDVLSRLLSSYHARVHVAESAAKGFDLVKDLHPDVILSDIGMPEEDGYSFLRRVRALDERSGGQIPAVAITAFARLEDRRQALLAGFQAHITKPVDVFELISTVRDLARP